MKKLLFFGVLLSSFIISCSKHTDTVQPIAATISVSSIKINEVTYSSNNFSNVNINPVIKLSFSAPVDRTTVNSNILFSQVSGASVPLSFSYSNNDSLVIIQPSTPLRNLSKYSLAVTTALKSQQQATLTSNVLINFITAIDSTDKFPQISDSALLDLVQNQTFKYFWDFGHPVSGMARERNTSGEIVTTGGTGFGIMSMLVGIKRNFITRTDGLSRIRTIVTFLKNNCTTFHGAFSHWVNGTTGATIPFSTLDNGGDLVETSFLMQGLLTARQYFNSATDANEIDLRNKINVLYNAVEWTWYRQNNQNILTWHWSPTNNFAINAQIRGWDEALITYVMAASSPTFPIPRIVYDNGWASNGGIRNNNNYFGYTLPMGPSNGGPLFFEHYSFLGINPNGLNDPYANYQTQVINHTKINYEYCKANPHNYNGYSNAIWGLTASDDNVSGYSAHEPNNDIGVISPTAAISSIPYTPTESLRALKFFYYKLGDRLWGPYGFYDAFNLTNIWFANSYLAIDQGPMIVMIENYRSGMLWNLFTSCPEVKTGMLNLGFTAPYL